LLRGSSGPGEGPSQPGARTWISWGWPRAAGARSLKRQRATCPVDRGGVGNGPDAERIRGRRHPKMLAASWLITQRKAAAAREVESRQCITGARTPIERRRRRSRVRVKRL
jgi:hypothetical protein